MKRLTAVAALLGVMLFIPVHVANAKMLPAPVRNTWASAASAKVSPHPPKFEVAIVVDGQTPSQAFTANWAYSFTAYPACSTTIINNCITNFPVVDTSVTPPATICTGIAPNLNCTASPVLTLGTHTFGVYANAISPTGQALTSLISNVVSVTVTPAAPTGLTVIVVTD